MVASKPLLYSAASKVCDGDEVFTAADIMDGNLVVAMVGPQRCTKEEGVQYLQRFQCLPTDAVIHQERGGKQWAWLDRSWTDMPSTRPLWHYLNHGRPGNARARVRLNSFEWVATRPIKAGEEVTFDYGDPDPAWCSEGEASGGGLRRRPTRECFGASKRVCREVQ
jgi:hypothetical protein